MKFNFHANSIIGFLQTSFNFQETSVVYSISDYIAWRVKFLSSVSEYFSEKGEISGDLAQGKIVAPGHDDSKIENYIKPVGNIRLLFDILLPIVIGLYSITVLIQNF